MIKIKNNKKQNRILKAIAGFIIIAAAFGIFILVCNYNYYSESYKNSEKKINERIAKQLKKDPNALTTEDFEKLESLSLPGLEISTLKPLQKLVNIQILDLRVVNKTKAKRSKLIRLFYKLTKRTAPEEKIFFDIKPLSKLKKLRVLYLNMNTDIEYIKPLNNLKKLEVLHVNLRTVKDVENLSKLNNLKQLLFYSGDNIDTSFFDNMIKLEDLTIYSNGAIDIESLNLLTKLKKFYWGSGVKIVDLKYFPKLNNLQTMSLSLSKSDIKNISSLEKYSSSNLSDLYIYNDNIYDISFLEKLTNLNRLTLYVKHVGDFGPLSKLEELKYLDMSTSNIIDLSPIANMPELKELRVDGTKIIEINFKIVPKSLLKINIRLTKINDNNIALLQKELPNLEIIK